MIWNRKRNIGILFSLCTLFFTGFTSCSVSYKFNGASIDYTQVKSISIKDFPNMASLVYPPLAQNFTEALRDKYIRQTRLQVLREDGTLDLEGEITGYELRSQAPKSDGYDSDTRLTITIRVRYVNNVNSEDDMEQSFSAYRDFSSDKMIQDVQDVLCQEIIDEIVDQIYNATVANW
jgi:hypothetical protein